MDNNFMVEYDNEKTQKLTKQLDKYLQQNKVYHGGKKMKELKSSILPLLESKWRSWVVQSGSQERHRLAPSAEIRFIEVGSTCLEKENRSSDLDMVVVIPSIVEKSEFIDQFSEFLQQVNVSHLRCVRNTPVPLIKFRMSGVDVDLVFSRVMIKDLTNADLDQDSLVYNMDMSSIMALNSHRNNMFILRLIPSTYKFSSVLRIIKIWAKNRGIYGSRLGMIGGISFSIMVAKISCEYDSEIVNILRKFFEVFAKWNWKFPVMIHNASAANYPPLVQGSPIARIMVSMNTHMPILTPVYPHQNTTQTLTKSAKLIWNESVKEAQRICENFDSFKDPWKSLLEPGKYFYMYNEYLYLTLASDPNQNLMSVTGFVESKLRLLIDILDRENCLSIAHVNVNKFTPLKSALIESKHVQNPQRVVWFIGIEFVNDGFGKEDLRIMYYLNKFQMILDRHWSDQQDEPRFHVRNTVDLKFATRDDLYYLIPRAPIDRN